MWSKISARLGKNSRYWGNISILMSGTVGAQTVGIASILVLARVYSPEDFGNYAFFFVAAGFLSLVATGSYDQAVYVETTPRDAAQTAMLAILTTAALGLAVLALGFAAYGLAVELGPVAAITGFLPLLAIGIALGGSNNALIALCCQQGRFGSLSAGRMAQAVTVALMSLALGLAGLGPLGLVIGFLSGQAVLGIWLAAASKFAGQIANSTPADFLSRAAENTRFPKFMLPSAILNYASANAITLIGSSFFSIATLGHYNLGQRTAGLPLTVVGSAMGDMFRSSISPQSSSAGEVATLFRSTSIRLAGIGTVLVLPLALFGPLLFSVVFGPEWQEAGLYVQIISPVIFARFVVSPLSAVLALARQQKLDMILQGLFVVSAFASIAAGAVTGSFLVLLIALTGSQTAIYGLYFFVSQHFSRRIGTA
ncbi:lipopolysaccharide biosynthesis protein [Sulfuriferula sp.]|uniref:lipopolysaccharide biosynthesis protein n=1 Tax=Sulfuriferula sp. TaxID=2025307 RepID=UPI0027316504|nr:oligosaccharide flippase family protein [Sulfuriferula sp.]MDP2024883.1 oligosaccharide flippase family protein [Sulfuriferula sp.]